MAALQKTSNQCEAREKNHGYASENNQSVRSAVRRRIQTLERAECERALQNAGKHKQWDEQEGMYQVLEEGKTGIRAINKKLGNVCN